MKSKATLIVILYVVCGALAFGQGQAAPPPAADSVTPAIAGVVAAGTKIQVIKDGFEGTEGPVAMSDGSLVFNGGSKLMKIDKDNNVSVFMENPNGANGLAVDSKGRLVAVLTAVGKTGIGAIYPKGSEAVLVDRVEGKPFGRPNDLVVDQKVGVYFTDPGPNAQQIAAGLTATTPAVYYLQPGGKLMKIAEGIERPNGIQLSPDEKILYVNNTQGEYLLAFDIQPDGTVRNRRNFAKYEGVTRNQAGVVASGADGLAVDSEGRVYAAANGGVQVFSPRGQHLGTMPVPKGVQNLAFAGPDKKILYLVGRGAAYKVQTQAQGFKGRAK